MKKVEYFHHVRKEQDPFVRTIIAHDYKTLLTLFSIAFATEYIRPYIPYEFYLDDHDDAITFVKVTLSPNACIIREPMTTEDTDFYVSTMSDIYISIGIE